MSYSIEQIASQSLNSLNRIANVLNIPIVNQNEYQLRYMILEVLKQKNALNLTSKVIVGNEFWNMYRDQPIQILIEEAKRRGYKENSNITNQLMMLSEVASRLPAPITKKVMTMEEAELNRTLLAHKSLLSQPYTGGEDIYDILRLDKASIIVMATSKRLETKNKTLVQIQMDLIEDLIKEDQFIPEQQKLLADPVGLATLRDVITNKVDELRAKGASGQNKPEMIFDLITKRVQNSANQNNQLYNVNAGMDLNTLWKLVIGPERNIRFLQSIGIDATTTPYDYTPYVMDYGDSTTVLSEQQIDLIHQHAVIDRVNLFAAINVFIPIMIHLAKYNAIRLTQSTMAQDPIFHMYLRRSREILQIQLRLKYDEVMNLSQLDLAEKLYISKGHKGITQLKPDEIMTEKEYSNYLVVNYHTQTDWFRRVSDDKNQGVPSVEQMPAAFVNVVAGSLKFREILNKVNLCIVSPIKLLNNIENFRELSIIYPYLGIPMRSSNIIYSLAYLYGYIYSLKGRYYLQPQGTLHVNKINKDTVAAYKRHYYRLLESKIRTVATDDSERRSYINSRLNSDYIINGDFNKELSSVATPLSIAAIMYLSILNENERNTIKDEYYQIISQIPTGYDRTLRSLVWGFPYKSATELDTIIERMQTFIHISDEKKEMLFELYGLTTVKELAGTEYNPLEQFIMVYEPGVNIDEIIRNLGMHIPPGINPDAYFRENFIDYKIAVSAHVKAAAEGRPVITKNALELSTEPEEFVRSELQKLSDSELIAYTGCFITYASRADMIERYIYLLRNKGIFYPVTRRCKNTQTTNLTDVYTQVRDATGNVTVTNSDVFMTGYGSIVNYDCHEPSEFETTFKNISGVVHFRVPNLNVHMLESLEEMPISEVRFLKRIYQWFINQVGNPEDVRSMNNIIKFINDNQKYYKHNLIEQQFVNIFNSYSLQDKGILKYVLLKLFKVGMIMRRWDECGQFNMVSSSTRVAENKLAIDIEFKKKNLEEEAKLPKYKGLSNKDLIVSVRRDIEAKLMEESGRDFGISHLFQRVMTGIEDVFLTFNPERARLRADSLAHTDVVLNPNPVGIEDFFRRLPTVVIIDQDYTVRDDSNISTILTEVYQNDLCIRIASNYCVATAAYHLGIFYNEDIPGFDKNTLNYIQ